MTKFIEHMPTEYEWKRLAGISLLTPGSFRTVRQSFHYLGQSTITISDLLTALE